MHDVFISFKNQEKPGKPTRDSQLAREVFDNLSGRGLRVFFSPVSLEELGQSDYKAAIDKALDSSRVLVAVGTSAQNLDAHWVRYEWDGFFNDILSGVKPDGRVFVYVEGCEPRSLPRALRQSQVFVRDESGIEKLASFIANALPASCYTRSAAFEQQADEARQPEIRPTPVWADALEVADQKELVKRYGPEVVPLAETYPFLKRNSWSGDRERLYRLTGFRDSSGDIEVACRICGDRQGFSRYVGELPKVCPDCGFEGDFSARVFVAYGLPDSALAGVIIKELQRAQFRIQRIQIIRTIGGLLNLERLREELHLCKACVCLWSDECENDPDLVSELAVARDLALPVLFLKAGQADPQPRPDTERVVDLNGPISWDLKLIRSLSDCLIVDERRRRESHG